MTILELILIAVIWIAYGVFHYYQVNEESLNFKEHHNLFGFIACILFSPLLLVTRIFIGIFSNKMVDYQL